MVDLDAFAQRTAIRMKAINSEKTASVEVMKYGLLIFINIFSIIFISLLIGFITGKLMETLLTLVAFALLRACTGGYHLKSSIHCIFFSSALMTIIPHIPMNQSSTLSLTIFSIVLVLIFAPFALEHQNNIPKRYYPYIKIMGIVLVSINLFLMSNTLALCFFVQSVMLIRRIGGTHYEKSSSD
jgi:accessory gene regulator B